MRFYLPQGIAMPGLKRPISCRFRINCYTTSTKIRKERERVVNIIRLPQVLPGQLDLQAINLSLRSGEATLDWSQVEEASQGPVAIMLAGLDLVEHSEILGIDTVPDSLSEVVLQALTRQDNRPHRARRRKQPVDDDIAPVVEEPEGQADLDTHEDISSTLPDE